MAQIPIHSCPWFAIDCSPFVTSPNITHPTDQVTIFTKTTSTTSAVLSDTKMISKPSFNEHRAALPVCMLKNRAGPAKFFNVHRAD
jgi:hypothetical protein